MAKCRMAAMVRRKEQMAARWLSGAHPTTADLNRLEMGTGDRVMKVRRVRSLKAIYRSLAALERSRRDQPETRVRGLPPSPPTWSPYVTGTHSAMWEQAPVMVPPCHWQAPGHPWERCKLRLWSPVGPAGTWTGWHLWEQGPVVAPAGRTITR